MSEAELPSSTTHVRQADSQEKNAHPRAAQLAAELLSEGTAVLLLARGSSMIPFIRNGDILTIEALADAAVRLDDIVFYLSPHGPPMVHRVIALLQTPDAALVLIRADASTGMPDSVAPPHVLGRITAITRNGRTFAANSPCRIAAARLWRHLFQIRRLFNRLHPPRKSPL